MYLSISSSYRVLRIAYREKKTQKENQIEKNKRENYFHYQTTTIIFTLTLFVSRIAYRINHKSEKLKAQNQNSKLKIKKLLMYEHISKNTNHKVNSCPPLCYSR